MRANFTTGALVASLAAGPVLVLPIVMTALAGGGADDWAGLVYLPALLLVSMVFGFVISLIPNFMGAAVMASIGERTVAARHPLGWAASGLLFGAAIGAIFSPDRSGGAWLIGGVGAACALISRRFATWPD